MEFIKDGRRQSEYAVDDSGSTLILKEYGLRRLSREGCRASTATFTTCVGRTCNPWVQGKGMSREKIALELKRREKSLASSPLLANCVNDGDVICRFTSHLRSQIH